MAKQPKPNKTEEAVEVIPGVFSDEAEDRADAETLDELEELAAEDQDQEDDDAKR